MQQESARKILAASFTTPDGGSRGAGALGGAIRDKIGNTAVLYVRPDGKAKFVESKDWGAGRGALLGGAIGILGGPLGIIAGGSIGALVSKLRDSGTGEVAFRVAVKDGKVNFTVRGLKGGGT
jgi:hypothetical protein